MLQVKQSVSTQTMSAVADVLDSLWVLLSWLDRSPFDQQQHYRDFQAALIEISILLATSAQRDRFAERPVDVIRDCCDKLADLSERVIRDMHDSLVLQPAFLDIATTKRKADEGDFGIVFESQIGGAHLVSEVRYGSLARHSGRIEPGDEIVQVNYQTVVGWQIKKMLRLMEENPSELILTLKKRPRHSPVFGQIYMKPFRIPSSARQKNPPNYFNNLPSPRAELLVAPSISFPKKFSRASKVPVLPPPPPLPKTTSSSSISNAPVISADTSSYSDEIDDQHSCHESSDELGELLSSSSGEDDLDEAFLPTSSSSMMSSKGGERLQSKSPTQSIRSVLSRPRSAPQRRATISGTSPSHYRAYINISEVWGPQPTSSRTSTLRSKDSGLSTMSSVGVQKEESEPSYLELRPKPSDPHLQLPQRPQTLAAFQVCQREEQQQPFYMNLPESSKAALTAAAKAAISAAAKAAKTANAVKEVALDSGFSQPSSLRSKEASSPSINPQARPRIPNSSETPGKKRPPIPQPRSISRTNSNAASPHNKSTSSSTSGHESFTDSSAPSTPKDTLTRSLRSLLPDSVTKAAHPVPTANFKSFKRVAALPPSSPPPLAAEDKVPTPPPKKLDGAKRSLPDYVNTSPPVIPARKPNVGASQQRSKTRTPSLATESSIPLPSVPPPPRPVKPREAAVVVLRQKCPSSSKPPQQQMRRYSGGDFNGVSARRRGFVLPSSPHQSQEGSRPPSSSGDSGSSNSLAAAEQSRQQQVPFHSTEVYQEGSPEKNWIDSLRRMESPELPAPPLPPPSLPHKSMAVSGDARLRSAHSYQPLPQYLVSSNQDEAKGLKFAFDMELGKTGANESLEEHDYTRLSDTSSAASERGSRDPELPPLFFPTTYRFQDGSKESKS